MKKSLFFLLFLLAGLTHEVAGQELAGDRPGKWHWQVSAAVQLAGRGDLQVEGLWAPLPQRRNERYGLGVSAWRDLHPRWAVGLGLTYHIHHFRYDYWPKSILGEMIPQPDNLRHAIGAMPAIRWQQAASRGVFVELATSLRLAMGETGRMQYNLNGQIDPNTEWEFVYEKRFTFGQALGLGYLIPVAKTGAISLRASALCEVRQQRVPEDFNYPEKPWRVQPGLELGWRWGR